MKRLLNRKTILGIIATLTMFASLCRFAVPVAAQLDTNEGVRLRPGLVIHPTLDVAYVMTPEGIAAVDLATGRKVWSSSEADKPLAISGNRLISLVEQKVPGNRLELAVMNIQEQGKVAVRGVTELPPGIKVSVGETIEGIFREAADPVGDNVQLTWTWEPSPPRELEEQDEDKVSPNQRTVQPSTSAGALQMSLTSGRVSRMDGAAPRLPSSPKWILGSTKKSTDASPLGAPTVRYESADGRHILESDQIADDRVWDKYRWTLFERATSRKLGEFRTHISFSPFVVRDSLVYYETTPYILGTKEEPAKLRAVSLETGKEVWSVEVREIVYRGPYPP